MTEGPIDWITGAELVEIVVSAVEEARGGKVDEDLWRSLAGQAPELVVPHLHELWDLGVDREVPLLWRAAPTAEVERLRALASGGGVDRRRAWDVLAACADADVVRWMVQLFDREGGWSVPTLADLMAAEGFDFGDPPARDPIRMSALNARARHEWLPSAGVFEVDLALLGWVVRNGTVQRIGSAAGFHISFPPELIEHLALPSIEWRSDRHRVHPTWALAPDADSIDGRWGGLVDGAQCPSCGGELHALLDLPSVPLGIGVSSRPALTIATCLSCLGWESECSTMWCDHDVAGRPTPLPLDRPVVSPQFPVGPFDSIAVRLDRTPPRWEVLEWGDDQRANLFRVGGHTAWIQDPEVHECPRCDRPMVALMQFDSYLPSADQDEWLWGSGGMAYVAWCDACAVSAVTWQCT